MALVLAAAIEGYIEPNKILTVTCEQSFLLKPGIHQVPLYKIVGNFSDQSSISFRCHITTQLIFTVQNVSNTTAYFPTMRCLDGVVAKWVASADESGALVRSSRGLALVN